MGLFFGHRHGYKQGVAVTNQTQRQGVAGFGGGQLLAKLRRAGQRAVVDADNHIARLHARAGGQALHALHQHLAGKLEASGRSAWLREDSERQLAAASDDSDPWPHASMRSAQFLEADGQRRLLRLLRWRDAQARRSDRPRSWILDNELAVAIARRAPADLPALQSLLEATPKSPRNLAEAIFHALSTPLADEADAPLARGDDRDKKQLRAMQDAVAAAAAGLGLPEGLLASRRLLEALQDGGGWNGALAGWRRALLEPKLGPLLAVGNPNAASV